MTALGYVRKSKKSEARSVSLAEQEAQIRAYCHAHEWALVAVLTDDGVSGGRRDRLQRVQAAVRQHRAGVVVVYHADRFARDLAGLLDTLRAWAKRGVALHVVGRGVIEVTTASGYLVNGVEGLMAEHYRLLIGEKTRDALARLKAQGRRYSGERPYGWGDPAEAAQLERVHAVLRANGHSLRAISRELAADGLLARSGRPFAPSTLLRLKRQALA